MSIKAVKKLKKIKADLDILEAKEEILLDKLDEAIDELEEQDEDQDVESGSDFCGGDGNFFSVGTVCSDSDSPLTFFKGRKD